MIMVGRLPQWPLGFLICSSQNKCVYVWGLWKLKRHLQLWVTVTQARRLGLWTPFSADCCEFALNCTLHSYILQVQVAHCPQHVILIFFAWMLLTHVDSTCFYRRNHLALRLCCLRSCWTSPVYHSWYFPRVYWDICVYSWLHYTTFTPLLTGVKRRSLIIAPTKAIWESYTVLSADQCLASSSGFCLRRSLWTAGRRNVYHNRWLLFTVYK